MAKQYDPGYCFSQIISNSPLRIIISDPVSKTETYNKLIAEPKAGIWQISSYTDKQVFHENLLAGELCERLMELTLGHYRQVNAFAAGTEHIVLISRKGICMYKIKKNDRIAAAPEEGAPSGIAHNRRKRYVIEEGTVIPALIDMGVFNGDGKVISSMYDKYRQINRFIEIIDDEISGLEEGASLNVIDFGCGKSYLTFVLYYYLTEIRQLDVNMIGLDLKADVIEKCNASALRYGYDKLHFEVGDINGYDTPFRVDMVVTLHACDTATDYALFNAVRWNARYIFSVPCCQHELNSQISANDLEILSRYGIIRERFCALSTDAIRAELLDIYGYRTQLLEFIDMEGTPKNLLIRAVRRGEKNFLISGGNFSGRQEKLRSEVSALCSTFGFRPALAEMLRID